MSTAPEEVDARWLLGQTRALLDRAGGATAGRWPRAAALLARQALEVELDRALAVRAPGLEQCSDARATLLCLRRFRDHDTALAVEHAWMALSHACHHHAYELPPTVDELRGWVEVVDEFVETSE